MSDELRIIGARSIAKQSYIVPLLLVLMLSGCNLPLAPEGEPPRPTVVIITATGPYFETFDVPSTNWLLGETDRSIGAIEGGEYVLTVKVPSYVAWTHNARVFGDGVYELDARFISGPESSTYGLILLAESNLSSFIYVVITEDGRYDIGRCDDWCNQTESLIGDLTLAYSIVTEEDAINHLRVEYAGGTLSLSINGAPVSTVQGIERTSGLVGLMGESVQFGGFSAAFDNLQVIEPNVGPPPVSTQIIAPTPTPPLLLEPTTIP